MQDGSNPPTWATLKNQNEITIKPTDPSETGTFKLKVIVSLVDYPAITLSVPFTVFLAGLLAPDPATETYLAGDPMLLVQNNCVLVPSTLSWTVRYALESPSSVP